jgi:hypothetical protein
VVPPDLHTSYDKRIDSEILLHGTQATVLDRVASLDDEGDRGGSTLGRLLEGVSHERARCLKGIPRPEIPRWLSTFGRAGPDAKSRRIWTTANKIRTKEGSACPVLVGQAIRNTRSAIVLSVIREIEIWRVAVLMVNRYADEAEANSFMRAEELAADGDHAGAAIWRRITVAIEQLTDTTGLPN